MHWVGSGRDMGGGAGGGGTWRPGWGALLGLRAGSSKRAESAGERERGVFSAGG